MACENSGVYIALVGEGVEPLLHVADHLLPQGDWVVDLVGHQRPPDIESCVPFFSRHTTPLRGAGQPASGGAAHTASLRRETVRYSIDQKPRERARDRPSAAPDPPRQRHRHLLRDLRQRQCRAAAADHGARGADDPLGRCVLRAARRARLSRDPLRQSRHRQVEPSHRRQTADAARAAEAALPQDSRGRDLQADRHGEGHGRPDGCARHQVGASGRRVDGRHDRAGGDAVVSASACAR